MVHESQDVDARIGRLERGNRRLTLALAALVVLAALVAAKRPEVARARAFQLIGPEGAVRAELSLRDGHPGLFIRDQAGRNRVEVVHDASSSRLFLIDEAGTTRVGVAQFSHGGGGVALHGPDSRGAAVLFLKDAGSLRFFDADGTVTNQVLAAPPRENAD